MKNDTLKNEFYKKKLFDIKNINLH